MSDYIYLLENRLSQAQRAALRTVREVTRTRGLTLFLVGGAVRDLTSGSPVRDLDVVVQGSAPKLKKELEKAGAVITGEADMLQALFLEFPGSVRMEFGSALTVAYPKPGKPVAKLAPMLDDLRRRDFTANAMALSLNDGSYGLLMDPLNGVADIENRQLRLVSNYGFIEDPIRMIRAARLMARLGWTLDEKTETRYQTGKEENYISVLSDFHRGYELEEIFHEEDPLRVLKRLEAEGWMKVLAPYWGSAKVNVAELERMRDVQTQLQMQGIHPDTASANFPLLTAKLAPKEVASLKAAFPRQGFVRAVESLEQQSRDFATQLGGKGAAQPSQAWRLFTSAAPEVVLWTAFASKSPALQAKFKSFLSEWPQARQKMPYLVMQEMRIVPELPGYEDLLEKLFFELMDGRLSTPEEMKAFLEPYSPPAPPPPVSMRRQRAAKKEARPSKSRSKKAAANQDEGSVDDTAEEAADMTAGADSDDSTQDEGESAVPPAAAATVEAPAKSPARTPVKGVQHTGEPTRPAAKAAPAKAAPVKAAPAKVTPAKAAPARQPAVTRSAQTKPSATKAFPAKAPAKAIPAKAAPPKSAAGKSTNPGKKAAAVKQPAAAAKKAAPPARKAPATPAKKTARPPVPAKSQPAKKTAQKAAPAKSTKRK